MCENGFVFLISQKGSWSLGGDIANGDKQMQHGKSHAESNVPWSLSPASVLTFSFVLAMSDVESVSWATFCLSGVIYGPLF